MWSLFSLTEPPQGPMKSVRSCLFALVALCGVVIAFGCCLNNLGLKYSRVSTDGSRSSGLGCDRELLVLSLEDSNFCCDGIRSSDWVCAAAYDKVNRVLTSQPWAYFLPLFPLLLTTIFVDHGSVRRLPFYAILFVYRLVVLYWGFDYVQSHFNAKEKEDQGRCWYAKFRRKGDCVDHFDFSDHIVFYIVQVLVPCAIELGYAVHVASFNFHGGGMRNRKTWLRIFPTALACLVLLYLSLRAVLFTSMYFHTPNENVAGYVLACGLAVWPVGRLLKE